MGKDAVTVAVRSRPLNRLEKDKNCNIIVQMEDKVTLLHPPDGGEPHKFTFDYSYNSTDPSSSEFINQARVYQDLGGGVLEQAFQGFNACLFAYGQTGSGKTFSMMGVANDDELRGIIPRLCTDLFKRIAAAQEADAEGKMSHKVEVQYMEIYNEKVKCLLNPKQENLKVRENPVTGPYVEGLTKMIAASGEDIQKLMEEGNKARHVAATLMNDVSSRSHAIFSLVFTQTKAVGEMAGKEINTEKVSKINLVDLAGSERQSKTGATGDRLKEGSSINKSLTTLGLVIHGLAEASKSSKKGAHIPYRDSTLTWILKENLGGNSKTFMISAISPANINYEETLSTLRYADRAKAIVTKAIVNENATDRLIRQLREEVQALKGQLVTKPAPEDLPLMTPRTSAQETEQIDALRDQLKESERIISELNMSWEEKQKRQDKEEAEREGNLKEMGIEVVKINRKLPYLVNLEEDPSMEEALVYYLKEGNTPVGNLADIQPEDHPNGVIALCGEDVSPEHCHLVYEGGKTTIRPIEGSPTYINGVEIDTDTLLEQSDRIIFGKHLFRYTNPNDAPAKSRRGDGERDEKEVVSPSAKMRKMEEEMKKKEEEMKQKEQELLQKAEEMEARNKEREEQMRREHEEQLRKQLEDEMRAKQQKEDEDRKAAEKAMEEKLRKRLEEEAEAKRIEQERVWKEEQEKKQKELEELEKVREEEKKRLDEEAKQAEAKRLANMEKEVREKLEAEAKAKVEEEMRQKIAMDEAERIRREEELRTKVEEELKKRLAAEEEARKIAENEQKVLEEQQRQAREKEREEMEKKLAELQADQERRKQEDKQREQLTAEANKKAEEETAKKMEELKKRLEEEERKRQEMEQQQQQMAQQVEMRARTLSTLNLNNLNSPPNTGPTSPSSLSISQNLSTLLTPRGTSTSQATPRPYLLATPRDRAATITSSKIDTVEMYKCNLVFVGNEEVGKTSLRKCLLKEPAIWERAQLPDVSSTIGIEIQEHSMLVGHSRLDFQLVDMAGQECYHTHSFFLPEQRGMFVFVWKITDNLDERILKQCLETIQGKSPGSPIYLVATHKDCLSSSDTVRGLLLNMQTMVSSFLETIEPNSRNRLQILGNFAVSCKTRTVVREPRKGGPTKFKQLLQVMAESAILHAKNDPVYPNGLVPSSCVSLARKIIQYKKDGVWVLTGMEYKRLAANIDARLRTNVDELAKITNLLHDWRVLVHFSGSGTLQKHIFCDPQWVADVVSALFAYVHYGIYGSRKFDPGCLAFDVQGVNEVDKHNNILRGVLTKTVAMEVYSRLLVHINKPPSEVHTCIELMHRFDLLYPVDIPEKGNPIKATTPINYTQQMNKGGASPNNGPLTPDPEPSDHNIQHWLVPTLFTGSLPSVIIQHVTPLLKGHHKKYTFNILPSNFFARLLVRVQRHVSNIFVGTFHYPEDDIPLLNRFWKNGAWVQNSGTTRALLRVERKSIYVSLNAQSENASDASWLFTTGLHNTISSLASEYRGLAVTESDTVESVIGEYKDWKTCGIVTIETLVKNPQLLPLVKSDLEAIQKEYYTTDSPDMDATTEVTVLDDIVQCLDDNAIALYKAADAARYSPTGSPTSATTAQ